MDLSGRFRVVTPSPDSEPYKGSYTFYFHSDWKLHWGGWLLLLDERDATFADVNRAIFDDAAEAEMVANEGHGHWILPKPNRLVVIAPNARHLISRIDQTAGSALRLSLGGFFK